MAAKKAAKKSASKNTTKAAKRARGGPKARSAGPAKRADKGEGVGAVNTRIASLKPPVRDIMEKLHPMIVRMAPNLEPTVKWGHAVYLKRGMMVLVAAPRSKYVGFGYTMVSGIKGAEPIDFHAADDVTEAIVAKFVKPLAS